MDATRSSTGPARSADGDRHVRQLRRLRAWQQLLDEAYRVPGTRLRFGWDAIVGLIPGAGDLITGLFGLVILYHAHRMRIPRVVTARMVINLVIDLAIGIVPIAGDVADIFWNQIVALKGKARIVAVTVNTTVAPTSRSTSTSR